MPKRELPSLAGEAWLNEPRLQHILRILNKPGDTRVAGGAVRNALLGVAVADVDLATTLLPSDVMRISEAAGLGVHPTGIDHGTVTLTHQGAAFEVTTLRRDVETDGRRAIVSFSVDWAEDAARRDFTINAMYCDPHGKIFDFTDGYTDIVKRRVKFVGRPSQRIREDYLRILRFFRFHAHYGKGRPDDDGLKACARLKSGLKKLSVERVRQELLKLLTAPRAIAVLKLMAENGILGLILPYTEEWRVLGRLPEDAILRLFVLAKNPARLKETLKLSNADAARLQVLSSLPDVSPALSEQERKAMLHHVGVAHWPDAVHLSWARSRAGKDDQRWSDLLRLPEQWTPPAFPVKGSDLVAAGFSQGPKVGQILAALEDWWVASNFVLSKDDLLLRAGRYKEQT